MVAYSLILYRKIRYHRFLVIIDTHISKFSVCPPFLLLPRQRYSYKTNINIRTCQSSFATLSFNKSSERFKLKLQFFKCFCFNARQFLDPVRIEYPIMFCILIDVNLNLQHFFISKSIIAFQKRVLILVYWKVLNCIFIPFCKIL